MPDVDKVLTGPVRRPRWSRSPHRSVSRALALAAVGTVLVAGCGAAGPDASTPVGRSLFGMLRADPGSQCVWIVPGDPGHTGAPVEIQLPSTVTVRFTPAVTVSANGRTFRAGDPVIVDELGPGQGRPGCPLPAQHATIAAGPPLPWHGIVSLSTPPPLPKSS
jgi:hypothetical protein